MEGVLRGPNRTPVAPGRTAPAALTSSSGLVNPALGAWHEAHDWPGGVESEVSKKRRLPSFSSGVSPWARATPAGPARGRHRATAARVRQATRAGHGCDGDIGGLSFEGDIGLFMGADEHRDGESGGAGGD